MRPGALTLDSTARFLTRGRIYNAALLEPRERSRTGKGTGVESRSTGHHFLHPRVISPNASLKCFMLEPSGVGAGEKLNKQHPQSRKWGKWSPPGRGWSTEKRLRFSSKVSGCPGGLGTVSGGRIVGALPGRQGSEKEWAEVRSALRLMAEALNHESVYSRAWKSYTIYLFAFWSPSYAREYNSCVCKARCTPTPSQKAHTTEQTGRWHSTCTIFCQSPFKTLLCCYSKSHYQWCEPQ